MRAKRIAVFVALALAMAGWASWTLLRSGMPGVVRVGYFQNRPYFSTNAAGEAEGAVVDLLRETAERLGVRLRWVVMRGTPEEEIRAGRADFIAMAVINAERKREFHLTEPWLRTEAWIISLDGAATPMDLAGRGLGVPTVPFIEKLARRKYAAARLVSHDDRYELVRRLCRGEAQAVLLEPRSVNRILLDRPDGCGEAKFRVDALEGSYQGIGFLAQRQNAEVADRFRAELVPVAQSGQLSRIYRRWGIGLEAEVRMVNEMFEVAEANRRLRFTSGALGALVLLALGLAYGFMTARRRAVAAAEVRRSFLANMSHEIRTPMNGVMGLTELLAGTALTPEQSSLVASIQNSGRSLLQILNGILDLSKLEAGKLELEEVAFRLAEPLDTVAATLGAVAREKGVELELVMDPALPPVALGDPLRLTQILFNLAGNAVKFTAQGKVRLEVKREEARVRFRVSDSGIGMDEATRARLFQPFSQAGASTSRRFGGTGLGLAIVKRLVEQMDGTLGVESAVGKGSTFWFVLPLREGVLEEPPARERRQTAARRSLHVLVVDDNAVNRRVAVGLAERLGHAAKAVESGELALRAMAQEHFDAVLLDCQMPGMDGYETVREIRRRERKLGRQRTWVIAATANALAEDRRRCLEAGMDAYLAKPFPLAELETCLGQCHADRQEAAILQ
jgi:signal transduction histidine kinase/CheY-like chemotaxis protein